MRRLLEYGGYAAAVVLVAFGIGALVLSINGKGTVKDSLGDEKIVGTADMTPDGIAAEAQKAGLGEVDTGSEARCFAGHMRIHALEAHATRALVSNDDPGADVATSRYVRIVARQPLL
jgi:hypothetical protein